MTTIRNLILVLAVLNWIFAAEGVADMTHIGFSLSPLENRINFIIPDYQMKENTIGGVDYSKPEIEGAGSIAQPGPPGLTFFTKLSKVFSSSGGVIKVAIIQTIVVSKDPITIFSHS